MQFPLPSRGQLGSLGDGSFLLPPSAWCSREESERFDVGAWGEPNRVARAAFTAALALGSVGLTACASSSYAGIPFAPGTADPELQRLARRAQGGDKQAQLDLGIRYEDGNGVALDRRRAEELYRKAASGTAAVQHVHSPAVGKHGQARVIGSPRLKRSRLEEARVRLRGLKDRRGTADPRHGGSNLSYSLGGPLQTPPSIASSLTRDEVWRRMIDRIAAQPQPLNLDDIAEMFGVPSSEVRQSLDSRRVLRFAREDGAGEFTFGVALRPCPKKPYRFVDRCEEGASILELTVIQSVFPPAPACPTNKEVATRLVEAGWTEAESAPPSGDARSIPLDSTSRDFDIFVRPGEEIYLQPSAMEMVTCISLALYSAFIPKGEK